MNLTELEALALSVGFSDPKLAASVAKAESDGNPSAYGDAQYGGSVGLWQINLPAHPEYDATLLEDPVYNARAAYAISRGGKDWTPWTTFRTGAYEKYYSDPTPRLTTVLAYGIVGGVVALAAFKAAAVEYTVRRVWGWIWA